MFACTSIIDDLDGAFGAREGPKGRDHLFLIGVHGLLQRNAELLAETLELGEVFCVSNQKHLSGRR
jgi:hypothetical protein